MYAKMADAQAIIEAIMQAAVEVTKPVVQVMAVARVEVSTWPRVEAQRAHNTMLESFKKNKEFAAVQSYKPMVKLIKIPERHNYKSPIKQPKIKILQI